MRTHFCITVLTRLFASLFLLVSLLQAAPAPLAAQGQEKIRLRVVVTGLRNDKGCVAAALFDSEKGFPNDEARAVGRQQSVIKERAVILTFDGIAPGSYGLALLHDENKNSKMDSNRFGFPREGYGVSNNPRPSRRGPKFGDARFVVASGPAEQAITVKIIYLRLSDVLRG